jgi:hypothetical protein
VQSLGGEVCVQGQSRQSLGASYVKRVHFLYNLLVLSGLCTKWYKLSASSEENMEETWTQRANNVLALMEKVPSGAEGSPEKNFQRAVWSLCQQLKDSETGGGQLIAPSIMSD